MTSSALKMLALVLMTIDHVGLFIPGAPIQLRWIGRLSAPIFLFCVLQGIEKTHDRKAYLIRMYLFSNATMLMNVIVNCISGEHALSGDIFAVYFAMAAAIYILEWSREKYGSFRRGLGIIALWQVCGAFVIYLIAVFCWPSWAIMLLQSALGIVFYNGYNTIFAIFGVILYWIKDDKKKFAAVYTVFSLVPAFLYFSSFFARVIRRLEYYAFGNRWLQGAVFILSICINICGFPTIWIYDMDVGNLLADYCQWMMIGALPIMLLYNGKRGKINKYFFYWYYPLHILVLYLIGKCFF